MKRVVTIKDIAEQLNLSRNTVAKALNGQYVPAKTRELVLKKAQELNYKSLNSSIQEADRKPYRILLVSGKPLNNINYFVPLIKSVENYCFDNNYELFQYTFNAARMPFMDFAAYVKELKPDGIIAIECFEKDFINRLLNLGKPICFNDFCTPHIPESANFDIIGVDDEQAVYKVVHYLNKKYKISKFAFVGDFLHCRSFYERYMGMFKALLNTRITHLKSDDILCNDLRLDYGDVNAVKTEILKLKTQPDCFVCCNDFIARTVCKALASLDINVPRQTMVVGFDNVSDAYALNPTITSFAVDKDFLGKETMRTLIHRIENPSTPSRIISVSTKLILRTSTNRD